MKNKAFYFIVFIMVFSTSFMVKAQEEAEYGVLVGLNLANLTGKNIPSNASTRAGLTLGAAFQYKFNRSWGIEPEALYSMRGATSFVETIELNYIEFPILVKYNARVSPRAPIFTNLFLGPSFAINVLSKDQLNSNGGDVSTDLSDSTNVFDYGITAGAGLDFDMDSSVFNVSIRYTFGISKVNKNTESYIWRNGVFAITASYMFK